MFVMVNTNRTKCLLSISGKARRGDGNDLTPNPRKLVTIGRELDKLNKVRLSDFNLAYFSENEAALVYDISM